MGHTFSAQFVALWNAENESGDGNGNLIPTTIGNDEMRKEYQVGFVNDIWLDSIKFAGIILIRRTLGIADGSEFRIDEKRNKERWNEEEKACRFGMDILNGNLKIDSLETVVE